METRIYNNFEEFEKRFNPFDNGVSHDFAKKYPNYIEDNRTNSSCWNCWNCKDCGGLKDAKSKKDTFTINIDPFNFENTPLIV